MLHVLLTNLCLEGPRGTSSIPNINLPTLVTRQRAALMSTTQQTPRE